MRNLAKNPDRGSAWRGFLSESPYFAEYSISAAAIAIFSLGFIIVGSICASLSFGNKRDYLLRPASMFYAFAGRVGSHSDWVGGGLRFHTRTNSVRTPGESLICSFFPPQ